ncbi:MAG: hypothetical protein IPK82_23210 [Polyangiaceae bacterium]|nr:hypothetical protein [Polyangiaceae bacterium]
MAQRRERRRSKAFDTEEQERHAFLSGEATIGVIAALLLTIAFATLLLSPSSYDNTNADATFFTVARYFHVILNTLSASFSASTLMLTFFRSIYLSAAPIDASDEIIASYVGSRSKKQLQMGSRNPITMLAIPFETLRAAYFTLITSIPFGVYLLHGLTLFIISLCIIVINVAINEIVNRKNVMSAYEIVTSGQYSARPDAGRTESARAESARAESARAESARADSMRSVDANHAGTAANAPHGSPV